MNKPSIQIYEHMRAFLIQTTKFNYIATTGLYVYLNTKCSWFSFKSSSSFIVSKLLQSTKSFLSFKANFNCNLCQCKTQVTYLQYTMAQIIHYHSKMKKNVSIMRKYRMKGKSKLSRAIFNFSSPCHIDDFIFPAFLAAKNSSLLVLFNTSHTSLPGRHPMVLPPQHSGFSNTINASLS